LIYGKLGFLISRLALAGSDCRSLAATDGAAIGLGPLTMDWQAFSMAKTAIRADFFETLDIARDLATEITLGLVLFLDYYPELIDLIFSQILDPHIRINLGFA
jgi:hypothetical protein